MSEERERRIQQLAHHIWESEGRPQGQALRHWRMAERLVDAELGGSPSEAPPAEPPPDRTD